MIEQSRWLSVEEIAFHLGIKKDTAYKWVARKHMPAHKVGTLLKFDKAEIDAWVRSGAAKTGKWWYRWAVLQLEKNALDENTW